MLTRLHESFLVREVNIRLVLNLDGVDETSEALAVSKDLNVRRTGSVDLVHAIVIRSCSEPLSVTRSARSDTVCIKDHTVSNLVRSMGDTVRIVNNTSCIMEKQSMYKVAY